MYLGDYLNVRGKADKNMLFRSSSTRGNSGEVLLKNISITKVKWANFASLLTTVAPHAHPPIWFAFYGLLTLVNCGPEIPEIRICKF